VVFSHLNWPGPVFTTLSSKVKPKILLTYGQIEIRDARDIWGQSVTDAQWAIRQELGDEEVKSCVIGPAGENLVRFDEEVKSCVIGPAGENLVRFANVMTGVKNAAGRTGMGCVMGSKNLKAVSVRGTMDLEIARPMEALEYNKRFINQITSANWEPLLSGARQIPGAGSGLAIFNTTSVNIPMISSPSASMKFVKKPWAPTI